MKKFYALLLAGVCVCFNVQQARAREPLLLIGPGARAIAMGESYVAIADDATASYFNPAALAGQTKKLLNFTHSKLADDLSYEFLAYAQPVEGWGNIGLNIALLNFGEQVQTGERGQILGDFSSYDVAVSAAYGSEITDNMSAGIGLKFIRSIAGHSFLHGVSQYWHRYFATDLGLLWKISPTMTFGTALRNLGPVLGHGDGSSLPRHIVAGLAYKALDTEFNDLLFSVDLYSWLISPRELWSLIGVSPSHTYGYGDGSPAALATFASNLVNVGGEYKYGLSSRQGEFFAMRGGYSLDRDGEVNLWTVGVGLKYNTFQVDVAYIIGSAANLDRFNTSKPSLKVLKSDHFCFALTLLL